MQQSSDGTGHWTTVILFGLIIFLGSINQGILFLGLLCFFIGTVVPLLWRNRVLFIACLLIGILSVAIPILAPIAATIVIIFYIIRINLVIQHWRPLLAGLLLYSGCIIYAVVCPTLWGTVLGPLVFGIIASALLHKTLMWLYSHNYDTKTALGLMGVVPLLILAFILPFLKLHFDAAPGDGIFGHTEGSVFDHGAPVEHAGISEGYAGHEIAPPGYHQVTSHIRTLPDGIPQNNLSYHGEVSPGTPNAPGIVHIDSYVRSNPDGIVENNLSFHGNSASRISITHQPSNVSLPGEIVQNSGITLGDSEAGVAASQGVEFKKAKNST